jgi:putative redox protein
MPDPLRPALTADLVWEGDLRFGCRAGDAAMTLDSDGVAGPSPVQALVLALAGCMAMDVVHVLRKGRHDLRALSASLSAERAPEQPRRLTAVRLRFAVTGPIDRAPVERAIALSREKYCSVWHSLRPDIVFETGFEIS